MATPVSDQVLETLRRFDSATVANVIELFDLRPRVSGYAGGAIRALYPELPPTVGFAVTATFRSGYPASAGDVYSSMPKLLAAANDIHTPRFMVFQDMEQAARAATFGEVMVASFMAFGFAGLITSGAGRDIEQIRARKFPCFASSVVVAHGYCRVVEINLPVVIDGLEVRPGDLLHADANGIVSIPVEFADEIASLCGPLVAAEEIVLECCRRAGCTLESYEKAYAEQKRQIASLEARAKLMVKEKRR